MLGRKQVVLWMDIHLTNLLSIHCKLSILLSTPAKIWLLAYNLIYPKTQTTQHYAFDHKYSFGKYLIHISLCQVYNIQIFKGEVGSVMGIITKRSTEYLLFFLFFNVERRGKKVNVKTGSRNPQGINNKNVPWWAIPVKKGNP